MCLLSFFFTAAPERPKVPRLLMCDLVQPHREMMDEESICRGQSQSSLKSHQLMAWNGMGKFQKMWLGCGSSTAAFVDIFWGVEKTKSFKVQMQIISSADQCAKSASSSAACIWRIMTTCFDRQSKSFPFFDASLWNLIFSAGHFLLTQKFLLVCMIFTRLTWEDTSTHDSAVRLCKLHRTPVNTRGGSTHTVSRCQRSGLRLALLPEIGKTCDEG